MPATGVARGDDDKPEAVERRLGRTWAGTWIAAGTGLACLLLFPPGVSPLSVESQGQPTLGAPEAAAGPAQPGFVERHALEGLGDTVAFLAADGLGHIAAEWAVLGAPDDALVERLALAPALLGALTVSLLVAVMLRLGVAPVAAVASALTFALSYPALHDALALDPRMVRAPMLAGIFWFLLARSDRRRSRGLWGAAVGLWLLGTLAAPVLLCLLPGMTAYMYLVEVDRRTCGYRILSAAIAGGLVSGVLLAWSGLATRPSVAAGAVEPMDVFLAAVSPLGLVFVAAAGIGLCARPTREALLVWTSWFAAVAWMLRAEPVEVQGLGTVLMLTVPLAGSGMSTVLRARRDPVHVWAVRILVLVLPASNLVGALDAREELREERARRLGRVQAVAEALPRNAAVATAANVDEPVVDFWRFARGSGPRVVQAPLDVRRILQLRAEGPLFAFPPTRLELEILGFRFSDLGLAARGLPAVARMTGWEECAAVSDRGWAYVAGVLENGDVGIGFGERSGETTLVLYVTSGDGPLDIEQGASVSLQSRFELDGFDRQDARAAGRLEAMLARDGVASSRRLGGQRFVQRVAVGRRSNGQPLAALRIDGRPGTAIARIVEGVGNALVYVCPASRRATSRRDGPSGVDVAVGRESLTPAHRAMFGDRCDGRTAAASGRAVAQFDSLRRCDSYVSHSAAPATSRPAPEPTVVLSSRCSSVSVLNAGQSGRSSRLGSPVAANCTQ